MEYMEKINQIAELSIIIPTYNETANIIPIVEAINNALPQACWQIIFVDDDSPDGTAETIGRLAKRDSRIRLIHRIGRKGLSSAVIEGMMASTTEYVALMDADLQHDETLLPTMLDTLRSNNSDLIIASRYMETASTGELPIYRRSLSVAAIRLTELFLKTQLSDPMSGFFMIRKSLLERVVRQLYGRGFKLLLDIFSACSAKGISVRYLELPYTMRSRKFGDSKLDIGIGFDLLFLICYRYFLGVIPVHFFAFSLVGLLGVGVNMALLWFFLKVTTLEYTFAYVAALYITMTNNFLLNNQFTFRTQRLLGRRLIKGLFGFFAACSVGAIVSVGVSSLLFEKFNLPWWLAGLSGMLVSAFWNFASSSTFVWNSPDKKG
ncbi:dolichol-phosphate mannosyltransferase [Gammaproteobacteria bacterium]